MVDARIVQTTKSLHAAIVELASVTPVSAITVADVTRAAGINRATFYSHATSPGALLTDVLTPELDEIRRADFELREAGSLDGTAITRKGMERVVDHVVKYRDIYRLALPDPLDASTHRALASHFEESSLAHFESYRAGDLPEGISTALAAGFIAHGLVGVIEKWLTGKRSSRKALVDNIVQLLPIWWD
ncbi:TetR/AcrR family transcriptional regulator [Frondihabitans cladoniiphilus]|uniref:HTH tetR-type domain-containing protein n=1 Tax=Frondihabitans cladoniiphilus TaxID=715785 RepID=A0ABP8W0S9_9MICO